MRKIVLALLFSISTTSNAQTITDTQTINDTELSITMDKRISSIIENIEENCKNKNISRATSGIISNKNNAVSSGERKLTNAEICKQNPRILGYKIQIAVVKSKEEADKIRTDFRTKFPNIKVEIDASLRPNYKILAGSYFTKDSAKPDLKKIKSTFGSAISIQYRVFCAEAK